MYCVLFLYIKLLNESKPYFGTLQFHFEYNAVMARLNLCTCPGAHSNTSVVHMHDHKFSKHTLIAIFPHQEKHPLNTNFAWFCPKFTLKQPFWMTCLVGFENMTSKCPLIVSKRTLFLENKHILTPNRDLRESRLASKTTPFFAFLWSRMCTTLIFKCHPPQVYMLVISQTLHMDGFQWFWNSW